MLVSTPFYAFSASNDDNNDLKTLETAIESGKAKQQLLKKTAQQIQNERTLLNKQIKVAAKQIQQSEAHLSTGEKKISALIKQEDLLKIQYAKRKKILATLLSALLKLEKNPPPALLTKPEDASDALRSAIILGKIVPEVKAQSDIIARNLANLNNIHKNLTKQQNELISNTKELRKQRSYIAKLLKQKLTLSSKTQAEIKAEQQKMAALGQKAKNIRDLFDKIERQKKLEIAVSARLAAELETKRLRDIAAKLAALELAEKQQNSQEIKQIKNSISALKKPPERVKHALASFASLKQKLSYPAQGQLLKKFGEKTQQGRKTEGITISTRPFAQITTPATGTIVFAGTLKGYGLLVIVNVGKGHHILLTGLGQLVVIPDQFVEAGDPIGIMPENSVTSGNGKSIDPILYVEFRKTGQSIDSTPWWHVKLSRK